MFPSDAYVPPQLFYNGKVDYFDLQRLGGLLSHLKKTLKGWLKPQVKCDSEFSHRISQCASATDTPPEGAQCQFVLSVTHTDSTSFKPLKIINKGFLYQVWLQQCYFCLPCYFSLFSKTHFNAHRCNVCFSAVFLPRCKMRRGMSY